VSCRVVPPYYCHSKREPPVKNPRTRCYKTPVRFRSHTPRRHTGTGVCGVVHVRANMAPRRVTGMELVLVMMLLVITGSANFVLLKVLYSSYGEANAFFVSQGINLLYVLYGGLITYPRLLPWGIGDELSRLMGFGPITPAMRRSPQGRFAIMGLLDCFGTFLTAMGAVYTPGQLQPVLNQSLLPCTMLVSALALRSRYSYHQLFGALLIVSGAVISLGPTLSADVAQDTRASAVAIYWLSNVPMACSAVYKESRFRDEEMDVCWLTQSVSVYQFLLAFALAPLQVIPGVGSVDGLSLAAIWESFVGGWACFGETEASGCAGRHTCALLFLYVFVNFLFNTIGLWLTKHGGAVLNSISYALLVPGTTFFFSIPLLGPFCESLHATTIFGLCTVIAGFFLYRLSTLRRSAVDEQEKPKALTDGLLGGAATIGNHDHDCGGFGGSCASPVKSVVPSSFQERVIGMGGAHRRSPAFRSWTSPKIGTRSPISRTRGRKKEHQIVHMGAMKSLGQTLAYEPPTI
jgi:hypothetical protein